MLRFRRSWYPLGYQGGKGVKSYSSIRFCRDVHTVRFAPTLCAWRLPLPRCVLPETRVGMYAYILWHHYAMCQQRRVTADGLINIHNAREMSGRSPCQTRAHQTPTPDHKTNVTAVGRHRTLGADGGGTGVLNHSPCRWNAGCRFRLPKSRRHQLDSI